MIVPMPEDADTVPIIIRRNVCITSPEETVEPGEKSEIVIGVKHPMWRPILTIETTSANLIVDAVLCGQICINRTPKYAREYAAGVTLSETPSPKRPIKIVFINSGSARAKVRAILATKTGE